MLISAFACAPNRGSEPGVGWGVVRTVAKTHRVWALTNSGNKPLIETVPASAKPPNVQFVYVGLPSYLNLLVGKAWFHRVYYIIWQIRAFLVARKLHAQVGFDLVHHVTYVNSWLPTFLGWLGPPFVWSAGKKERTPWSFLHQMSWQSALSEMVRDAGTTLLGALTHIIVATRSRAILTASPSNKWQLRFTSRRFALGALEPEDMALLQSIPERQPGPFRMVSIGRLLGLKGFSMAMRAFAQLRRDFPDSEYWIIGDGQERHTLEQLADELGCVEATHFLGWLPRQEVLQYMAEVDVVVHPSLHEQFAYVLLEAMAAAKPVICLDVGGPSALVGDKCGFKIPVHNPAQVLDDIYQALHKLASNPSARLNMGEEARAWAVENWTWEAVGKRLLALYEEIV